MIEILPIGEAHLVGFRNAVDSVARERLYLSFFEGFPQESSDAFVRENIAAGHPHFVAVSDGSVVGWCDITPTGRGNSAHVGVLGIGLLPAYRGQGLGRQLMQRAIDTAWQGGRFTRVELTVNSENANAIALYRKLGFEIEGRKRNQVLIDGRYLDLLVMGLLKAA
jgi:RimJ/RimL family protein N-acetyltransferase